MATTSLWAVKSRVDHVLDYATDEQKTDRRWSEEELQAMRDVMDYAMNGAKTEKQLYITGLQCDLRDARNEMALLKRRHHKEDRILAFHGYQSFKPGEVTPDIAHEIGVKLAEELWPDHQVIVATHLDKAHIHNHFVLNSVSLTGRKFYSNKTSYKEMRIASDRLCKQYSLSVITEQKATLKKHYTEWAAENDGAPTWRSCIREDMDAAIKQSMTLQQFINNMKKKGYMFERRGEFLRVKTKGMKRFVRLRSLGNGYSEQDIQQRILQQQYPTYGDDAKPSRKIIVTGDFRLSKVTWKGLRALYFFYVRKLRAAASRPYQSYPFMLKDDLRKLDAISEQSKFLYHNKLDTGEQVEALKEILGNQLSDLQAERRALSNEKRRTGVTDDRVLEIQSALDKVSSRIKKTRHEIKMCNLVFERSLLIGERNLISQNSCKNLSESRFRTE